MFALDVAASGGFWLVRRDNSYVDGVAMHVRHLATVRPGFVLARAVYTERGDVLLAEGAVLTQAYRGVGLAPRR